MPLPGEKYVPRPGDFAKEPTMQETFTVPTMSTDNTASRFPWTTKIHQLAR